jgi:hypothetical protein
MTELNRLKKHLMNLQSKGITSSTFKVQYLIDAINEKPLNPEIRERRIQGAISVDGGKFGVKDED